MFVLKLTFLFTLIVTLDERPLRVDPTSFEFYHADEVPKPEQEKSFKHHPNNALRRASALKVVSLLEMDNDTGGKIWTVGDRGKDLFPRIGAAQKSRAEAKKDKRGSVEFSISEACLLDKKCRKDILGSFHDIAIVM